MGIAITESVAVSVYRAEAVPEGTPEDVARAAQDTVGAAIAAARGVPGGTGLVEVAKDAFVSGFHAAAAIGTVLARPPPVRL